METQLEIINPAEFGLKENEGQTIQQAFVPKVIERDALHKIYEQLITREISFELSQDAASLRKKLVKVRTSIAEIHKSQKAYFLAGGRFADAIKNKETQPIEQMEEKLYEIEKFVELQEQKRIDDLQAARFVMLIPYNVENADQLGLGIMSDQVWENFFTGTKTSFEAKIEAAKKAEADRIAKEKEAEAERERMKAENDRLKLEAEAKAREMEAEKAKADAERKALEDKAKKEKDIADAKLKAEREANEKLQAQIKAKADAEKAEAVRIAAEEKKAKAAPDKVKLNEFALMLDAIVLPSLKSDEAKKILADAKNLITKTSTFIRTKTSEL